MTINNKPSWIQKRWMVCDIKGWRKIQFMNEAERRQDALGEKIAKLLNESGIEEVEICLEESSNP